MTSPAPPAQVTGAEVLGAVVRVLKRFVYLTRDEQYDIVALWIAHTYVFSAFRYTPRLGYTSDGPGCGKTVTMEITGLMVPDLLAAAGITAPGLRAAIETMHPVIALDEADIFFGASGRRHEDARAILNSGYERNGKHITAVSNGTGVRIWRTFAPVMFAGIGTLPATVADRAVVIKLAKPPASRTPETYRPRLHDDLIRATGQALGEWVRSVGPELGDIIPDPVEGVALRQEAISEPLLIIGELAGGGWRDRSRIAVAAVHTSAGNPDAVTAPPDVTLLADIRRVFTGTRMPSSALVRALRALPGSPWRDLWTPETAPAQLAGMLRPLGITPRVMRVSGTTLRSYERAAFAEPWAALLPAEEIRA